MSNPARLTASEFSELSAVTPRAQKAAALRKVSPHFNDAAVTDAELDAILYGVHLMMTSPAFA